MFRALLAHLQEALHKQQLVFCLRVMSVGCYQDWSGTASFLIAVDSSLSSKDHIDQMMFKLGFIKLIYCDDGEQNIKHGIGYSCTVSHRFFGFKNDSVPWLV
jgi:hypothetical protein